MAARPKLTPEQWADVRSHWEKDPRGGYSWIVEELGLPVSVPGVRKTALRDGWAKAASQDGYTATSRPAASGHTKTGAKEPKRDAKAGGAKRAGKVSKVSENRQPKISGTIGETMKGGETIPMTTAESLERDPDKFGVLAQLTDMQEVFVREYMVDWNGTQAAIRAGYSAKSAGEIAYQLLQKPSVREAIETLASARARRLGIDADELMRMWAAVVTLDANEISQLRRVCCPYCWGADHQRQYTPSSLEAARLKHERERQRRMKADQNDDIGEFPAYTDAWYDKRKPPSEDCPECHGEGTVEVFFADTRTLSPAARLVYAGVKEGRDGIEVLTMSKEKAADNLARALGLFKDREAEVNINLVSGEELYQLYEDKMRRARERQAMVLAERGIFIDPDGAPQEPDSVYGGGADVGDPEQQEP